MNQQTSSAATSHSSTLFNINQFAMRAWQPSADVWVLAHTKLVTKDFTPPSDARVVESKQKLEEDWQRRKPVMSQQCQWQKHLATEPRCQSASRNLEEDLKSKVIHPSTQPLVKQILSDLTSSVPDDIDIWYMSALRATASGAHGAGTFLIGSSSNRLCAREVHETVPFEPHRHWADNNQSSIQYPVDSHQTAWKFWFTLT